jgi:hypothetical protein
MSRQETMTVAERAALATYPPDMVKTLHGEVDFNASARAFFLRGFMKAEERLGLVKALLKRRAEIVEKRIKARNEGEEYYKGKLDGYRQALDLLNSSEESIRVEL